MQMVVVEALAIWLLAGAVAAYWLGGVMQRRSGDYLPASSAINAILPSSLRDE
jgi:hypothetical protein